MQRFLRGLVVGLIVCGFIGGYLYHLSTLRYEGYVTGINDKENDIGMVIDGKGITVKISQETILLDNQGNKVNIEDFNYFNWAKVSFDRQYSDKQFKAGEAVAVKIVGIKDNSKDITELGPYKGPADTKDYDPKIYAPHGPVNPGQVQKQTTVQPSDEINKITSEDQKQVEELIKAYFNALERKDYVYAWELISTEQKEQYPKSEALKSHWGIESVRFTSMKGYLPPSLSGPLTWDIPQNTPVIWFYVKLDIKPNPQSAWDKGINERFVIVTKESDGKWRINALATSP